ncbi:MAG: hypothetical protein QOI10_2610 [Solirubrobacterales bacterium]|nr:hypothetical protein [Solirubrobacterales bacterium]
MTPTGGYIRGVGSFNSRSRSAALAFGAAVLAAVLLPCVVLAAIGDLDTSFGTAGRTTTDVGGTDVGNAVAFQSDGRIIVAGSTDTGAFVARYSANGALDVAGPDPLIDPGFGPGGTGFVNFNWGGAGDKALAVAVQSDDGIVVAGQSTGNFAVARLNANGTLDPSFDGDGKLTTDLGATDSANAVAVQSDNNIVAAGTNGTDFALTRYSALDGALDTSFSGDGKQITDLGGTDIANAVAIQPGDGNIVAVGTNGADFALARYSTANGALDTSFSGDGMQITDLGGTDIANAVAIQPADGNIVAAGTNGADFALARYSTANGALDTSFDADGKQTAQFGGTESAFGVAIQSDGLINAAGSTTTGTNPNDAAVAQFTSTGFLNGSFSSDGKTTVDFPPTSNEARAIAMQPGKRLVIVGFSGGDVALARLFGADDGTDTDEDGINDTFDNCPTISNFDQANYDGDAQGDVCDADDDNDNVADDSDSCPTGDTGWVSNGATDNDHDGCRDAGAEDGDDDNDAVGDGSDNCQLVANTNQANNDGDAQGDACDPDDDNDTVADGSDNCSLVANTDQANNDGDAQGDACDPDDDNDNVADGSDNCQLVANADQANNDGDAQGDACDADDDNDGVPDAGDACPLVAGAASNGCAVPPGPTTSDRGLTLSHSSKPSKFKGTLTADVGACAHDQQVRIFHKVKGPDKKLGTATSDGSGKYSLKKNAPDGKYYASAPEGSEGAVTCLAAKSGSVNVH